MIKKTKVKKGISLIVLLVTIAVILILLTTITVSADNILNNTKKRQFAKEIYEVQNLVNKYKVENEDYPYVVENDEKKTITINVENLLEIYGSENITDNTVTLYPINLSKAGIQNLSRGTKRNNNTNDVYAFSNTTGIVYYVKGYKVGDNTYYTLTDELKSLLGFKTKDSNNSNVTIVGEINLNEYIKYGLILHYDGINNTRNGQNPDATAWEDLSGNNNDGILVNGNNTITYKGKGYEFTNNSDYIESMNNLGLAGDVEYTIEVVYKNYGFQNEQVHAGAFVFGSDQAVPGRSLSLFIDHDKTQITWLNNGIYTSTLTNDNKVHSVSFSKTDLGNFSIDNTKLYVDNNENNIFNSGNITPNLINTPIQIGRTWQYGDENRTLNGIVYSVRVYNRALSDAEIKHNYEIDCVRFNVE